MRSRRIAREEKNDEKMSRKKAHNVRPTTAPEFDRIDCRTSYFSEILSFYYLIFVELFCVPAIIFRF